MSVVNWTTDAVAIIKARKIEHPHFLRVEQQLARSVFAINPEEIIPIVGPSRVGKTRVQMSALGVKYDLRPDVNGHMPVVYVEVENSAVGGFFSTKDFMSRCLRAIYHPIYGERRSGDSVDLSDDSAWEPKRAQLIHRTPETVLREAFEHALRLRKTQVVVFDEVQHVGHVHGGDDGAARVLDSWKCLANTTRVKLVLSGSYDLLNLLPLAPHLAGRQQTIHFARYRSDVAEDVTAWLAVLKTYSSFLRFRPGESLTTWARKLYEGSLGCVGQLSRWLRNCLVHMQLTGCSVVTEKALDSSRLPPNQLQAMALEIQRGERHFAPPSTEGEQRGQPTPVAPERSSRRKPGSRRPRRNPRGGRK